MTPYMSARKRTELFDNLFEAAGGFVRALAWIEKSDENYEKFFLGPYAKGALRAVNVEHTAGKGIEDMIEKLDKAANAMTIDGTYTEKPDASD